MKIRSFVVFAIYFNILGVGVSLWTHHLGWAVINMGCILWNLFSLELLDKKEDK